MFRGSKRADSFLFALQQDPASSRRALFFRFWIDTAAEPRPGLTRKEVLSSEPQVAPRSFCARSPKREGMEPGGYRSAERRVSHAEGSHHAHRICAQAAGRR